MKDENLILFQAQFERELPEIMEQLNPLFKLRDAFISKFDREKFSDITLEEYAIGTKKSDKSFCYIIERKLDGLGSIVGATAFKFGIYFGKIKSDKKLKYRFTKKYGESKEEAFKNVKNTLIKLLEDGENENLDGLIKSKISPMFKGKILSTYYPEKYLGVFSSEHLDYFLVQLNADSPGITKKDPIIKRKELLKFKNQDPIMKNWTNQQFQYFLYNFYPKKPNVSSDNRNTFSEYVIPSFPTNPTPKEVNLTIVSNQDLGLKNKPKLKSNPDYEARNKRNKMIGNRGEKIVLEHEKLLLKNHGLVSESKNVKKAEYDHLGYDIESYDLEGNRKYIEVKTTSNNSETKQFHLTANEFEKASSLENYHLYLVYDILSNEPKIWKAGNPFNPINVMINLKPQSYVVKIGTKENKDDV